MENVLTLIKRDHERIAEAFTEIQQFLVEDADFREGDVHAAFHELKRVLVTHLNAEEEAVYTRLRGKELTRDFAFEGAAEHGVALELLEKMSNNAPIDEKWRGKFVILRREMEKHLEEEEFDLLPLMKRVFSFEELVAMGKDLRALEFVVAETAFSPRGMKMSGRPGRNARPEGKFRDGSGGPDIEN